MSRAGTTTRDRRARSSRAPAAGGGSARAAAARPRRWVRRRGRRHPLLVAALVPLVLATVAWVLWASPLLAVRTVQVDGVRTLTAADVRQAVHVPGGTPLLRVDLAGAAARVRALPQVASAQVTRGWPDRLVVTLTERVPVAVVDTGGQLRLADRTGVLFETVTGDPPPGVLPLDVPHPGPHDPATTAGLAAITSLPPAVRAQVATVRATSGQNVTLALRDGTTVVWGSGDQAQPKAAALRGVLDQIRAGALARAGTVDVSAPDKVVLR